MRKLKLLAVLLALVGAMVILTASPALAQTDDDFNPFLIFDDEDEDVQVIVCDSDDGDVERVDDVVVVFCGEDDDDDDDDDGLIDALFDRRFDDHHFDRRDHDRWHR